MTSEATSQEIRIEKSIPSSVDDAFSRFVNDMFEWWPHEYTWAADKLAAMYIEPKVGGRCIERDTDGNEIIWGTVLVSNAPHRLVFSWQISPERQPIADPAHASEIEVLFSELAPDKTAFIFEHRYFDRHGGQGDDYRAALASDQGWPLIVQRFVESFG